VAPIRGLLVPGGQALAGAEEGCQADGLHHAGVVCYALACDVEGGAVVDGGADEGQAEVDADALFEAVDLDGDVALVVVHGEDNVVDPLDGLVEDYIGGNGALGQNALSPGVSHCGGDGGCFFVAQKAAVAGVGIESRGGDPGCGESPIAEALVGEFQHFEDSFVGNIIAGHAEGAVGGEMDDAQAAGDEHGGDSGHTGDFLK